uniref:Transposase n=1 Tax=Heterorhabditis bacteriophora TaxID=37862 RepID=A0A1I7WWT0_HETBA
MAKRLWPGHTITAESYCRDIEEMHRKLVQMDPALINRHGPIHLQDNCVKRKNMVGFRSKAASDALIDRYFRRLGVLPFLASYLFNISECLPPLQLPSDRPMDAFLDDFWT